MEISYISSIFGLIKNKDCHFDKIINNRELSNMNYDNPAARLLSLITSGKEYPTNTLCRSVWETLLEVENNNPLLISRLGKVMELPDSIISALKEHFPSQHKSWAYWEPQVNGAFMSQNLNSEWATFINRIDDHSIAYLELSADLLQTLANTKSIVGDDMDDLRQRLNQILSEVMESDISSEVKKFVARNIRKIIVSLDEYKLTGALPILDAIDATIGHAHVDKSYMSFLQNSELGGKLLETLAAAANVVTVAVGLPQLSQAIALIAN
ncbi:hypothetical protein V1481_11655 [Aeromonas enteropelogenes]|uniref:hypothetical protein n=1 Tax=Aeromonas enteropelogenes TaxID=29489 RepID=UPI00313553BD